MDDKLKEYQGPLYLELNTDSVIGQPHIVHELNSRSKRIIHNHSKTEVTTWEMNDLGDTFKVIMFLQAANLPFSLLGDPDLTFIVQQ